MPVEDVEVTDSVFGEEWPGHGSVEPAKPLSTARRSVPATRTSTSRLHMIVM